MYFKSTLEVYNVGLGIYMEQIVDIPDPTEWIQCIENEPGPKGRAALRQELIQCAQKSTFCVQSSLQEKM